MKRNVIVAKLIKEGFSEKTLVNFSDKQLFELSERMLSEVTTQIATVYNANDAKDVNDLNALISNPASLAAAQKKGAVKVQQSEEEKPSSGLSKEKKSEIVKKAKKGGDIGKKGKGFEKLANKAAKEYGSKEKGEKVAAASMWKNIKRESIEVKKWVNTLAEENFHNFTSKNEIMELIQVKLNESDVQHGPNVKKGHNGVPEFMSYEAITASGPSTAPTKPAPTTKPGTSPGKPKPKTPYQPGTGPKHQPKALGIKEEDVTMPEETTTGNLA
jgi:hypothetical protein